MNNNFQGLWKEATLHRQFFQANYERWVHVELFTHQWWILLGLLILPWLIWIKLKDKQILLEIVLVGAFSIIVTTTLDSYGWDDRFWIYPTELFPYSPRGLSFDFSMVPIAYMLIYQYFKTWKRYTYSLIMMSALYAFVGEPISHILQLVYYEKWNYLYSFVYYIVLGLVIKWVVLKLRKHYRNN